MNALVDVDPARRQARVQPGVIWDDLRDAAEEHGLTFGPDPATHDHATLGGMIGNNSCGTHAVLGRTVRNRPADLRQHRRAGHLDLRRAADVGRRDQRA
jgi:FAD/FMN-containing dehydrogenase